MSSVQRRLYLQCQLPGGDRAYHLLYLARVRGSFPLDAAQAFANRILERHESLRTGFRMDNGDFISELHAGTTCTFTVIEGQETDLDAIVQIHDKPFDLATPPLFRVIILRLSESECILIFNCHHLIFDGYSSSLLGKDIFDTLTGQGLLPLKRSYADYVQWENRFFQSAEYEQQRDFWCQKYRTAPKRLPLPYDFNPPASKSFEGDYFIRYLESKALKAVSRDQGATPFMTMLAAFYCVLYKLTRQDEITIGTLVSPRESGGFQNVIGLFANTLPLTQTLTAQTTFAELLDRVRSEVFQAMQHADFPFEHLVRQLPFLEKGARNPLFDVVFNFERVVRQRVESFQEVTIEPLDYYAKVSMFDLAIDIVEYEDQIRFKVEYATTLFREESIKGLMDCYFGIIRQVCSTPDITINDLQMVDETAQRQLAAWNNTDRPMKKGQTFLDIWRQQLDLYADYPALRQNGRELTYLQLEEQANRLAHYLLGQQIDAGTVVAVAMDQSPEWIITILALWKIAAVYLPLAATHPRKRLLHQLADSGVKLVITQSRFREIFDDTVRLIALDTVGAALATCSKNPPGLSIHTEQPAYIIYTSGSTGLPKGVLVNHQAVHAHIDAVKGIYRLQSDDNLLQFSSPTFDASLEQILVTLSGGACLVLLDSRLKDPHSMLDLIVAEEITVAEFPPAYLKELVTVLTPYALQRIRRIVSGGEILPAGLARQIKQFLPREARLLNFYGPTETTMAATVFTVPEELAPYDSWLSLPIGKPLTNTHVHILDQNQQLVPVGIPGELCIGGARLALGYLNQPELTAQKFINLERPDGVERVYRTGDRARWLADGNIEFLGRMDRQVQLRGYRIELGEIERVMETHPLVSEAIVIKNGDQHERLDAFVVSDSQGELNVASLYEWLNDYLPDYMIPASFTCIAALPRNSEGKLDMQALNVPSGQELHSADAPPLDSVEWALWRMWREILRITQIGRNDVFFHIGGNSLSAIQMMVKVKNIYGIDLPLALLLQTPTIAKLADFIRNSNLPSKNSCIVPFHTEGSGPAIVLIPGLGGNVLDLYELSAHLDKGYPCYGVQHPWEIDKWAINDCIEDLAAYYLSELESVISIKDCIIIGHSFGGYVAYEMARILQLRQHPPQALHILDVAAPHGSEFSLTKNDVIDLTVTNLMGNRIDNDREIEITTAEYEDRSEWALQLLKSANRLPGGLTLDNFRHYLAIVAKRADAFSRYTPASGINQDIVLYRAEEIDHKQGFMQEDGHWPDFTNGTLQLHWVPGGHFNMLKGKNAERLAQKIHADILQRAATSPD